ALLVLQQIVLNVVAPRVMSQNVGIHPLVVFLAFLLGFKLAGLWGAIFGVPVAGVVNAMVQYFIDRTQAARPLLESGAEVPPAASGVSR
ncbi:MAG TPA: AI-2E family transporter, partial [Dehalococcoidia bacterium]|nr:AI-2E family transporter [Dehalococcoidia bacterium]